MTGTQRKRSNARNRSATISHSAARRNGRLVTNSPITTMGLVGRSIRSQARSTAVMLSPTLMGCTVALFALVGTPRVTTIWTVAFTV